MHPKVLVRVISVVVRRRSGGWMATTIVDHHFWFYSTPFPSQLFLIERLLGSKILFCQSWWECPKLFGVLRPFPPFGDDLRPFWILQMMWLSRWWVNTPFFARLVLLSNKGRSYSQVLYLWIRHTSQLWIRRTSQVQYLWIMCTLKVQCLWISIPHRYSTCE